MGADYDSQSQFKINGGDVSWLNIHTGERKEHMSMVINLAMLKVEPMKENFIGNHEREGKEVNPVDTYDSPKSRNDLRPRNCKGENDAISSGNG